MALNRIYKHNGDAKQQVYLYPTDADTRLQSPCHLCPEHHLLQMVLLPQLYFSKSLVYRPDMRIYLLLGYPDPLLLLIVAMFQAW